MAHMIIPAVIGGVGSLIGGKKKSQASPEAASTTPKGPIIKQLAPQDANRRKTGNSMRLGGEARGTVQSILRDTLGGN